MADHIVHPDPAGRDEEDPVFIVYEADLANGRITDRRTRPIPGSAIPADEPDNADQDHKRSIRERDKIHPRLRRLILRLAPNERQQLVIVFTDQPTIPRYPELTLGEPRDSERNAQAMARAVALTRSIREQRTARYVELIDRLSSIAPELEVIDRYWIINGLLVEATLGSVNRIAEAEFVLSIEPRFSGEQPPAGVPQIDDGRAVIGSDPYFDHHLPTPPIALLDSGVRHTHKLLNKPGQLRLLRDCVDGGTDCNTGPNLETGDVRDHGTATAAILIGNDTLLNDFRGVTQASLDSFRIYRNGGSLDHHAAPIAFQHAVEQLNKIIVVEIQCEHDDYSSLAVAADSAFDAGRVVIAANGNANGQAGQPGTVRSPASARRVIGVGSFNVSTRGQDLGQSRGPTSGDNRIKPDIQGPTMTYSARNQSDTATGVFDGTSCATPYVAGAAALIYGQLVQAGTTDPGQVYAQLILAGSNTSDNGGYPPVNNTSGAGRLQLRRNGTSLRGKVALGALQPVNIPVSVPQAGSQLEAAIWWPEYGLNPAIHNTITLTVIDPAGAVNSHGAHTTSVFQRLVARKACAGDWTVVIHGADVPDAPHTVYWAVFVTPPI